MVIEIADVAIGANGTESQSYGSWTTCYSLDALLTKHDAQHLSRGNYRGLSV